jgi:predicted Zn-dependent protease with MMP-like domain
MAAMTGQFDDPRAWRGQAVALADIEALAGRAYARLPAHFRALCADLVIRVEDFPTREVLDTMGLRSRYDLLGLFQGIGLPFRHELTGTMPNMIWLYRKPILAYWTEHQESLAAIVTHVLVHEIGHHFGFSDEDMEAIEEAADDRNGA